MDKRLAYSVDEACDATGIGRTKLYDEIQRGNLIAVKCGRRTVIRAEDLYKWLANLRRARVNN